MSSPDGLKAQLDIALKRTTWSTAELKQLIESDLHRNSSRFAGRTLEEMIGKLVATAKLENW
ncbi:MAG TPA: hypothetical protein VL242_40145, partial [Sorangium sp.]|nr:hypothetical protein [Sorangium sp.]